MKALFLLGPTASGKTALAFELVDRLAPQHGLEIISVDSALVYRGMNIGTAKPNAATLARYPHHLIDLIAPTEAYSAARFRQDALRCMAPIVAAGRVPLLVGGTMLYAKALLEGLSELPPADPAIRLALDTQAAQEGWPALHAELARVDPITAARLSINDPQRIQRALEVYRLTGTPLSALQKRGQQPHDFPYRTLLLGLDAPDRSQLHQRIAARFDTMLKAGLIDELAALRQRYPLLPEMPAMRAVGYRQTWEFLEGRIHLAALREQGIIATRQLAKRQLTWLRTMPDVETFDCHAGTITTEVVQRVKNFLDTP